MMEQDLGKGHMTLFMKKILDPVAHDAWLIAIGKPIPKEIDNENSS